MKNLRPIMLVKCSSSKEEIIYDQYDDINDDQVLDENIVNLDESGKNFENIQEIQEIQIENNQSKILSMWINTKSKPMSKLFYFKY